MSSANIPVSKVEATASTLVKMSETPDIHTWHVIVGGFRQTTGEPTGMQSLFKMMHSRFARKGVEISPLEWNSRFADFAELIRWTSPGARKTRITIASYSWGTTGARNLARELYKRGFGVHSIVSSDGVYRHGYWAGQWRALVPWSTIYMPGNVKEVHYFVQRDDKLLKGHKIDREEGEAFPKIAPPIVLDGRVHNFMDESEEFHEAALLAAERVYAV